MGLAEPRKRTKLAHDPRNIAWSSTTSTSSYGHRLMSSQGWRPGQALGSQRSAHHTRRRSSAAESDRQKMEQENAARLTAARVGILFKDDNLGLGAKRKSEDVEARRAGLDAFAGLLGRLNAKDEGELNEVEKKQAAGVLERYARAKGWGMVFVPGGVLVRGEEFGNKAEMRKKQDKADRSVQEAQNDVEESRVVEEVDDEKKRQKAERKRRKEEKRARKEAKEMKRRNKANNTDLQSQGSSQVQGQESAAPETGSIDVGSTTPPNTTVESNGTLSRTLDERHGKSDVPKEPSAPQARRNGRQMLRARNIEAKRMAFSDTKGLDAIFMKK